MSLLQKSPANENYIPQKRPILLRSLLIVATPYFFRQAPAKPKSGSYDPTTCTRSITALFLRPIANNNNRLYCVCKGEFTTNCSKFAYNSDWACSMERKEREKRKKEYLVVSSWLRVARGGCRAKAPRPTTDVSCLLRVGSGIYGARYLRAIGCFSMSQCATGPARERKVCPRRSWMEENEPAHLLLLYDDCLVTQHP